MESLEILCFRFESVECLGLEVVHRSLIVYRYGRNYGNPNYSTVIPLEKGYLGFSPNRLL